MKQRRRRFTLQTFRMHFVLLSGCVASKARPYKRLLLTADSASSCRCDTWFINRPKQTSLFPLGLIVSVAVCVCVCLPALTCIASPPHTHTSSSPPAAASWWLALEAPLFVCRFVYDGEQQISSWESEACSADRADSVTLTRGGNSWLTRFKRRWGGSAGRSSQGIEVLWWNPC